VVWIAVLAQEVVIVEHGLGAAEPERGKSLPRLTHPEFGDSRPRRLVEAGGPDGLTAGVGGDVVRSHRRLLAALGIRGALLAPANHVLAHRRLLAPSPEHLGRREWRPDRCTIRRVMRGVKRESEEIDRRGVS